MRSHSVRWQLPHISIRACLLGSMRKKENETSESWGGQPFEGATVQVLAERSVKVERTA